MIADVLSPLATGLAGIAVGASVASLRQQVRQTTIRNLVIGQASLQQRVYRLEDHHDGELPALLPPDVWMRGYLSKGDKP